MIFVQPTNYQEALRHHNPVRAPARSTLLDLCNHSLNGRVFADVTGRKIGWNNGRCLGLNECRTTAGQNGCHKE
jgi:hypothetical protein